MGRSRRGGTQSKIRGAVGSTVYQITKDSQGRYYQKSYVREYTRTNNNSPGQARARMIMGQIQRMFHILPEIITGAFATIPKGTQCFQHFARINYPLLRLDFENNFDSYGHFDFRPKYDMSAPAGIWKLTEGILPEVIPDVVESTRFMPYSLGFEFALGSNDATYGDLLKRIGMQYGDTLYILFYRKDIPDAKPIIEVCRLIPHREIPLSTRLDDIAEDDYFTYYGQLQCFQNFTFEDSHFNVSIGDFSDDTPVRLACIAFLLYRPTDGYPLFSSSQFRWFNEEWWRYYQGQIISETYQNWCDVVAER